MGVSRQFRLDQSYGCLATRFANITWTQSGSLALVQWGAALKIGQGKGSSPVAAVLGAEQ